MKQNVDSPAFYADLSEFEGATDTPGTVSIAGLPVDVLNFFRVNYYGRNRTAARADFVARAVRAAVLAKGGYITPEGRVIPLKESPVDVI